MWAVTASMYDVQALSGLLQPLCILYRRYVSCYILFACCTCVMWAVTSSLWDVTSSMYDVQALCGLLHVLTLTLTIIRVQCRARNPNPTTVAATRPKRRRVVATVVGLGFLDTAL